MQVSDLIMTLKVLIIGLGQLGLAAAKYVKERGFDTYGHDINTAAMEISQRSAGIKPVTDFGSHDFDVYVICVSTHKSDDIFSPQIDGILSIADKISREAKKDATLYQSKTVSQIIQESDVSHSTAYRKIRWLVEEKLPIVDKIGITENGKKSN